MSERLANAGALICLMVVVGMLVLLVVRASQPSVGATPEAVERMVTVAPTPEPSAVADAPPLNTLPPSQLTLDKINYITEQGGRPVLILADDSRYEVNLLGLSQLPSEVQTRIAYDRAR